MATTRPNDRLDGSGSTTRNLYRAAFADPGPSDDRGPDADKTPASARQGLTFTTGLLLLIGIWLVASPFLLGYVRVGGIDGSWNSVVAGAAVALLALVRLSRPGRPVVLSALTAGLGAWLLLAQHILGYSGEAPRAAANETTCGVLVVLVAAAGLGFALAAGRLESAKTRVP